MGGGQSIGGSGNPDCCRRLPEPGTGAWLHEDDRRGRLSARRRHTGGKDRSRAAAAHGTVSGRQWCAEGCTRRDAHQSGRCGRVVQRRLAGRMIFNLVVFGHGSHEAAWRRPDARATAPLELAHWAECARQAEEAGFDGLFLGDILCLQDHPEFHPSEALDPFIVLAAIAGMTKRLTLIGTASASFNHPFHLARRILSLHHLSGGRAGWNIVTSSYAQEAANFGWEAMPETEERYAMAEEVTSAVKALWHSWDGAQRIADKTSGRWLSAAPATVKREGRFGAINGALNLSPEPWGQPVLAQAGSSPEGVAF